MLGAVTSLAWPLLDRLSTRTIGHTGLPWLLMASARSWSRPSAPASRRRARVQLAERTRRALGRVMGRWIGDWLERHASRFRRTDEQLVRFFERDRAALVLPMLLYSLGWVVRGVETLVYLQLLGVSVSLIVATVVESTIVLIRSVAVPVPAGLGVQDASYVLTLGALGVPDAMTVGTAFVLLKRGKDLFWILFGFVLLAVGERRDSAA